MPVLLKQSCPTCGQSVNEREISLFGGMVESLFRIWKWAKENNKIQFSRKEIKHLFKGENEIARFGDWILFGNLVFRPSGHKGQYALNMARCNAFFAGKLTIPTTAHKNPLTKEIRYSDYGTLGQVKKLKKFLNNNMEYIVKYRGQYESPEMQQPTLL